MSTERLGGRMLFIACVLGIALLTGFFQLLVERDENPNRQVRSRTGEGTTRVLLQRNRIGHYVATGSINGRQARFLLDTGATTVSVPEKLARTLELEYGPELVVQTAAGPARAYHTVLREVRLGDIVLYDVAGTINPYRGAEVLLGMNFLGRLEFKQQGDTFELVQHHDGG